jgi:hypothetical protein
MGKPEWGVEIPGGFFLEEKHLYRDESGLVVPSSTQVLDILGMTDFSRVDPDDLAWKRGFGNAVHRGIELNVFGKLDWDTVDEAIIPAVVGVDQFLGELQYQPESAEERRVVRLNSMAYGMTLDHRGSIMYHGKRRNIVIDVKTGSKASAAWSWQGGGYVPSPSWLLLIAQVSREGRVTPHWVDALKAQREFIILLAAAHLKLNAGLAKIRNVEEE